MAQDTQVYQPKNKIRIVTAASLFDGHDAAINIMRRVMQSTGAEIIHLGHDRSVEEIVDCAIQEDVQAIAITSYQGGHNEYFKFMYDLLQERNCGHIKIFGGGGGVILPEEIKDLMDYGIARIYSPDDGRAMGLQGMINDLMKKSDFSTALPSLNGEVKDIEEKDPRTIASLITAVENNMSYESDLLQQLQSKLASSKTPVLGITGTGGAGKSTTVDEFVRRFLVAFPEKTIAILSVDPTKRKSGGALLGDRIRMNSINSKRVYMRSMATRESNVSLSKALHEAIQIVKAARYDLVLLESSGIGQSGSEIVDYSDVSMYVMTPEYGAASQLEKIDMLDYADIIALNKFDKQGGQDAVKDVKKQVQRNHGLWDADVNDMPVYGTIASQFNDPGMNELFQNTMKLISVRTESSFTLSEIDEIETTSKKNYIIPPSRVRYLSEIVENNQQYDQWVSQQSQLAQKYYALQLIINEQSNQPFSSEEDSVQSILQSKLEEIESQLDDEVKQTIDEWHNTKEKYAQPEFVFRVRDKEIKLKTHTESLSHLEIPKVCLPKYEAWGDIVRWAFQENVPGSFPYTSGVYPFKRTEEDPTRMFAGEGSPERTNKRFHYVSKDSPAKRLSTAFDSVTLYGQDPNTRPDIFGKIGNAGVSIWSLDAMKKLYSGFELTNPKTSVSMTINGPAASLMAFFLNTAIDQECEKYIIKNNLTDQVNQQIKEQYQAKNLPHPTYQGALPEGNDGLGLLLLGTTGDQVLPKDVYEQIKADTISQVRGTVQADILKEDQAQNTCIFSTDFSLKLMGDVQQYFIDHRVRNFYSVSISGYHIAEAGANPITQLAFTLANGFTYLEYYLSRGMNVDDFAPNFSFFFSNGLDPEYAVIGRVARRIWAKALKYKYKANKRSQLLKYHIQTSGRSLHAQEIQFNDIRTTLQALYAIYDNCNSLHTNAYDEAITTPTEESVRRAMAIQLIINKELGLAKNENPIQGAFIIEELTDLVEEAVLAEFNRITERGGVLGAMETMYQRSKIQEESMYYEWQKHNGSLPIIGVNTYLGSDGSPTTIANEVIRSTTEEKNQQIEALQTLHSMYDMQAKEQLKQLNATALRNENMFTQLMEAVKYCSLGQITNSLFDVGGKYRRCM